METSPQPHLIPTRTHQSDSQTANHFTRVPTKTTPEYRRTEEASHRWAFPYEDLIGRHFTHPSTQRLYEVIHINWDTSSAKVAAYRKHQGTDGIDPDDCHPYAVEGPGNIAELVDTYDKKAGILSDPVDWPTSESSMLHLQRGDPHLKAIIAELRLAQIARQLSSKQHAHPEPHLPQTFTPSPSIRVPSTGNAFSQPSVRYYYMPFLSDGSYGALRTHWFRLPIHYPKKRGKEQTTNTSDNTPDRPDRRTMIQYDPHYTEWVRADYDKRRLQLIGLHPNDSDPDASPYTVLPPSVHRMALRFFHDGTGHPGHMRTRFSIQTQYYWPGMERDTEDYVNNCTFLRAMQTCHQHSNETTTRTASNPNTPDAATAHRPHYEPTEKNTKQESPLCNGRRINRVPHRQCPRRQNSRTRRRNIRK